MDLFYIFLLLISQSFIIFNFRNSISKFLLIMDYPNDRKIHSNPTPSIGGIIIFPMLIEILIYSYIQDLINLKILIIWLSLIFTFFFVGFLDDRENISAKAKIFIFISLLFIIIPLDNNLIINSLIFKDINNVIVLNQGSIFFTVLCIFFFNNALNFSDGANGISINISLIIILYFLYLTNFSIFYLLLTMSLIICLIPNILGKYFIGNSGVNVLSIFLALLFLKEYNSKLIGFDEIMLLVLIPSIDAVRVVIQRIISKKSPLTPDKTHLHHYLCNKFKKNIVFIPYTLISALPIMCANTFLTTYSSIIIFCVIYLILIQKTK